MKHSATSLERRLARWAARDFAALPANELGTLQRIARRWTEQDDLALYEWATEYGVDYRMLWRAAHSIGIRVTFGKPGDSGQRRTG